MKRSLARATLRVLRAIAVTAVAAEAVYVVAMNVFLSTPLFEKAINATPDVVDIHYSRGWSLFPTRIHATNLSIRGMDSHVEWILRFDEIDFDCTLRELAKMRFHVTRARGSGITFRARLKVAAPEATAEALEYLPPIDSLGSVALIPSLPPYPGEWDDSKWHLWTVQIDDAIAEHVREVWIEGGRFEGDARVAGGFYLKPMRAARVGPARVDVRRGSVAFDARTVLEPVAAGIDFNLEEFDPRVASGSDILRQVTLAVDAEAAIPNLNDLGLALPDSGQVEGRVEIPRLAVRLAKGTVGDDSHIDASGAQIRVTTAAHVVSGGASLSAAVARHRLEAQVSLAHLKGDFALSIPQARISVDSGALDLLNPFTDLHGVLDVPDAELPHAADLAHYLPKDIKLSDGFLGASVHAEGWRADKRVRAKVGLRATGLAFSEEASRATALVAHLSLDVAGEVVGHSAEGTATLDAKGIHATSTQIRAGRNLTARVHIGAWNLRNETLAGDLALAAENVTGAFGAQHAALDLTADRIDVRASTPELDLKHPSMRGVDYGLHVGHAELADARTLNALLPSPAVLTIESGRALLSADIQTSGPAHAASGRIDLALHDGGIRLRETHLAGDFALVASAHGFDPARALVDLEGSRLAMRNVRVTGASTDTSAWSGDLVMQAGTLGLSPVPRLEGDFTLQARDANPILGVLFRDTLPAFVAQLAQMPSFTAVTHILVEPESLVVSDLVASGGDLALRGTYVVRDGDRDAAFVVQKGPLSVGVNLDNAGSHVRLFGLDTWYGDEVRQALAPR